MSIALISLLASKPQKVFEREEILNRVWGNEVIVGGRTIDVHIRKLREKIGDKHFKTGGSFFTIPPQIQMEIASRKKIITSHLIDLNSRANRYNLVLLAII